MTEVIEDGTDPAGTSTPTPPEAMSDERVRRLKKRAEELLGRLAGVGGAKEMALLDGIKEVGVDAQRSAAAHVDLLKGQMSGLMREGGTSKDIANGLNDLRLTLNQISPEKIGSGSFRGRVLSAIGRTSPMSRAMNRMALRYEPVSKQVVAIETSLREGQSMLDRDNVELRLIYQEVESSQEKVQENVFLGELLMEGLEQIIDKTDDETKRDRLTTALHDVATRVQDLASMEQVNLQYFAGINMVRDNNNRLGQSIDRTVTLATNVVTVGLAIQAALVHEALVKEAAERTRIFLGDMIVLNAVAINRHTREIGDLYNQPVIAIDKIAKAHDELIEALDTAGRLREEGIKSAKVNIAELKQMTESLEARASEFEEREESPSLKA